MFFLPSIRCRAGIGGCVLALVLTASARAQPVSPMPPNLPAIRRQALALMSDITPHEPFAETPIKVSHGADHAFWGTPFGDKEIAAPAAVDLVRGKDHELGDNADLCLLRWDHGWRFQQWVGKIAATVDYDQQWDWAVKRRTPGDAWYVVSHLNVYPAGEHLSWRCDAGTHTLVPTGWPGDAVPSISGDTITFTHQDKPGYSPTIRDIYRFTDRPSERIARCSDVAASHEGGEVLTLWDNRSRAACTWQIHQVGYTEHYALCRTGGETPAQPFREDAQIDFDWGDHHGGYRVVEFLWRRLSGLSFNALRGDWEQDGRPDTEPPRRVAVTGLPEAVQRLSWPTDEGSQQ